MEEFIKVGKAARLLQCTPQSLYQLVNKGFLPSYKVGYYRDGRIKRGFLKSELEIFKKEVVEKSILRTGGE